MTNPIAVSQQRRRILARQICAWARSTSLRAKEAEDFACAAIDAFEAEIRADEQSALAPDVIDLICAARQIMERGYVSTSIADERPDAEALDKALEAFASRVCYDDDGGSIPEAHADPCTCGNQKDHDHE